jgi:hypothetical protein
MSRESGFDFAKCRSSIRQAVGPTHPLDQCVPGTLPPGVKLTTHLHVMLRLRLHGAIHPLPLYVFMAWCLIKQSDKFVFTFHSSSPLGTAVTTCGRGADASRVLRQATSPSPVHASGPCKADVCVAQTLARTRVDVAVSSRRLSRRICLCLRCITLRRLGVPRSVL